MAAFSKSHRSRSGCRTCVPPLIEEAHRQSLAVAKSPYAQSDQDFIDAVSILDDDE